jgi:hypothetical protein
MPRPLILSAVMIATFSAGPVVAQERPNFDGPWVMDMTRSESAAQAADATPRTPVKVAIETSASSVTVRTTTDGKGEHVTYTFDPATRADAGGTSGRDERAIDQAQARWEGPSLITVTIYRVNGMSAKKPETRWLSSNGKEMTVETEMQMQHGYESDGKGPAGYGVAKDVYVRDSR